VSQQTNWVPSSVDLTKPSAARMYDYLLGGNHNFEVDRELVERIMEFQPEVKRLAILNRSFLRRAVLFMLDNGIRQFLDLGSGIPTVGNVHEIAQAVDPASRVLYVDNEYVAVAHSQLILEGNENAVMLHADVTRPGLVLQAPLTTGMLDFDQPVGLLAVTLGHYILDEQEPVGMFAAFRDAVPSGSLLAITHLTDDLEAIQGEALRQQMTQTQNNIRLRSRSEVLELFGDFEFVEPGLVTTSAWRPERGGQLPDDAALDGLYAGVARKP
jgi:hypothetical protein